MTRKRFHISAAGNPFSELTQRQMEQHLVTDHRVPPWIVRGKAPALLEDLHSRPAPSSLHAHD